jgi:histidinol dehydrogenase
MRPGRIRAVAPYLCVDPGRIFVGPYSAVALGDCSSGLNHTLPTNNSARCTGGLP